ncbi:MAG: C45 family peptidase [Nocardioidaceae bacterium]
MSPQLHVEIDSADPFERGRQRGALVAEQVAQTWPVYQSLFEITAREAGGDPVDVPAVAHACLDALSVWSPELVRELEGVAAGAGVSLTTVMALNARTEILAKAGGSTASECSTLVRMQGADTTAVAAQTWDWHDDLADGWHLQSVRGDALAFVGLAEFGMLAKIGVNSAGLGVHFNLLRHASDLPGEDNDPAAAALGGIPVHLLARAVLGTASTLTEAIELVRSARVAASTVLIVVTPDEAACVEMCPAGVGVVEPSDGWLVHTNHFLDPVLAEGEAVTQVVTTTFERQDLLRTRVKAVAEPLEVEELVDLLCAHDEDGVPVCRHPAVGAELGYRTGTLATVALDPVRRQAHVSADGPCRRTDVSTLTAAARS